MHYKDIKKIAFNMKENLIETIFFFWEIHSKTLFYHHSTFLTLLVKFIYIILNADDTVEKR